MPIARRTFILVYLFSLAMAAVAIGCAELSRRLLPESWGAFMPLLLLFVIAFVFGAQAGLLSRLLLRCKLLPLGHFSIDDPVVQWWILIKTLSELGQWAWSPFALVFFKPGIYAFFGAKIGKRTAIAGVLSDPSLTEIGDGAVIGINAVVAPHVLTGESLTLARIKIGAGATVAVGAVLQGDVEVGSGSTVAANAVVTTGSRIPSGELWGGLPARKLKSLKSSL